jgi:hypothetical protein
LVEGDAEAVVEGLEIFFGCISYLVAAEEVVLPSAVGQEAVLGVALLVVV